MRNGLRAVTFGIGYDGTLELRFMPVNADIQNGDLLVTSGIDGTYPPGLPVAVVSNIERNAAYAFARITCTPAAGVNQYRSGAGRVDRRPAARNDPVAADEQAGPKGKKAKKVNIDWLARRPIRQVERPPQEILLPVKTRYIAITLFIALVLNLLAAARRGCWQLRPDFVALTLIFWVRPPSAQGRISARVAARA